MVEKKSHKIKKIVDVPYYNMYSLQYRTVDYKKKTTFILPERNKSVRFPTKKQSVRFPTTHNPN